MTKHKLVPTYPFAFTNFPKLKEILKNIPLYRNSGANTLMIDDSIDFWKKTFTSYCHDVNRATVKVFIATHFNLDKTEKIMRNHIKKTGVKNIRKHIENVVLAAHLQVKKDSQSTGCSPSWHTPKPSDTDYKKPDETNLVPPPSFAQLVEDDINWDMFNWNLLSELDKDALLRKKILREL